MRTNKHCVCYACLRSAPKLNYRLCPEHFSSLSHLLALLISCVLLSGYAYSPNALDRRASETNSVATVFTVALCPAGSAEFQGETVWRGQRVQIWHCYKPGTAGITRQYFNPATQRVIRQEYAGGDISG